AWFSRLSKHRTGLTSATRQGRRPPGVSARRDVHAQPELEPGGAVERSPNGSLIAGAGRGGIDLAGHLGALTRVLAQAPRAALAPRFRSRIVVEQMYEIGVKSLPLTAIASLAIGLVLAMQTIALLKKFGAVHYVAVVVGLSVVKELGPVVTALMVAGRAG